MKTESKLLQIGMLCGLAFVLLGLSLSPVTAQNSTFTDANWSSMGGFPGANGPVNAAVVDGAGNLYIGGDFTNVGDVIAYGIAKWDGANWSALGSGIGSPDSVAHVSSLVMSGGDLYVGGTFSRAGGIAAVNIAKWNGSSWSALDLGMNGDVVSALAVSGSDLYAAGAFSTAGDKVVNYIAKWNGSSWSALGSGMNDGVRALAVSGGNLYAGGYFTTAGGISASNIAKWDGNTWSALGSGVSGGLFGGDVAVFALAVSGSDVYAGGRFTTAGGIDSAYIAKWNGSSWSTLGAGSPPTSGLNPTVYALAASGHDLYAGGSIRLSNAGFVAKWNGTNWSALGSGMGAVEYPTVSALAASGTDVYAGGEFKVAGGDPATNIAKWNGSDWLALGSGLNSEVSSLAVSGSDLYVAGLSTTIGRNIAKWDGNSWSALGSGFEGALFLLAVSGSDLYAGGDFYTAGGIWTNGIAKWSGSSWSMLGTGFGTGDFAPRAGALAVSGNDVYAGGSFTTAGGVTAKNIAKWNGSSWSALDSGMNSSVNALAVSGSDLYAGGEFTMAGGVAANNIAKWNGSSWTALGSGLGGTPAVFPYVTALAVSGSDVYAGGRFTTAGGVAANNIAKWNGTSWSALGSGIDYSDSDSPVATVSALAVSGNDLYAAGGAFTTAGGRQSNYIAKWNGSSWSALGSGLSGYGIYTPYYAVRTNVSALAVSGNDLYVGGSFTTAGGKVSPFIARAYLPGLPALSVRRSGTDVSVSWPSADTTGFALEQAGALSSRASWVANTSTITDDGAKKSVALPATTSAQFFRLRR